MCDLSSGQESLVLLYIQETMWENVSLTLILHFIGLQLLSTRHWTSYHSFAGGYAACRLRFTRSFRAAYRDMQMILRRLRLGIFCVRYFSSRNCTSRDLGRLLRSSLSGCLTETPTSSHKWRVSGSRLGLAGMELRLESSVASFVADSSCLDLDFECATSNDVALRGLLWREPAVYSTAAVVSLRCASRQHFQHLRLQALRNPRLRSTHSRSSCHHIRCLP